MVILHTILMHAGQYPHTPSCFCNLGYAGHCLGLGRNFSAFLIASQLAGFMPTSDCGWVWAFSLSCLINLVTLSYRLVQARRFEAGLLVCTWKSAKAGQDPSPIPQLLSGARCWQDSGCLDRLAHLLKAPAGVLTVKSAHKGHGFESR